MENVKRKPVTGIISGELDHNWLNIAEAINLAPSAGNTQPWRFFNNSKNMTHVYMARPNLLMRKVFEKVNHVDVGIALAHVLIAAEHFGKTFEYKRVEHPVRKDQEYILSVIEKGNTKRYNS